jgi:DNA-binding GntR family transcriptional regulator
MSEQIEKAPSTAARHALEGLRRAIVAGQLRPGERIGQEELADRLGVSLAPVREALAALEQEGQLTYRPRRGYFVTELRLGDLEEIYALRALLEGRAARAAMRLIEVETVERIELAARDVANAVGTNDVAAELIANRRFHMSVLEDSEEPHTMRVIRQLWDSTEAYRALYYNSPTARVEAVRAHERIVEAVRDRDADRLVAELDDHRRQALSMLVHVLR